ncbi:MAG: hypothetical protein H6566_10200 [Lewinellaceae bacterium]|nr:hypothetical protein [Lewinellaceae bacterium]
MGIGLHSTYEANQLFRAALAGTRLLVLLATKERKKFLLGEEAKGHKATHLEGALLVSPSCLQGDGEVALSLRERTAETLKP